MSTTQTLDLSNPESITPATLWDATSSTLGQLSQDISRRINGISVGESHKSIAYLKIVDAFIIDIMVDRFFEKSQKNTESTPTIQ